ncbi:MAG: hypothetical protein A4S09_06780 [Proteobacteria bacterium SG_bin7]|nr:MAG: hypothetical protein A4S09_06780 [Proteobacteria bacterium SG_bin7]
MRNFPALLARQSGTLTVSSMGVEFFPDDNSMAPHLVIPMTFLQIKREGKNSDYFFLYNRNHPEVLISVSDRNILEVLQKNGFRNGGDFGLRPSTKKRFVISTAVIGTILVMLFVLPLSLAKMSGNWLVSKITPEVERQWLRKTVLKGGITLTPENLKKSKQQVGLLVDFLKSNTPELQPFDIEIVVSQSKEVNAFAIPGGILMINSGFLEQAETAEEVMGVLAHELGHIERRHNVKSMISGLGIATGALALSLFLGTDISEWVVQGSNLLNLKYTRDNEREADERGLYFLEKAKISSLGMIAFFERLSKKELGGVAAEMISLVNTHPLSAERIRYLKELSKKNSYTFVPPPISISEIKDALR